MYLVTQTNQPEPEQVVVQTLEQAEREASEMCREAGDTASIYRLERVGTCECIPTVTISDREHLLSILGETHAADDHRHADESD